jgi:hypothetical protein
MLENYIEDLKRWTVHPYNEDGDLFSWFLFVGLLTCGTILWTRVVHRLVD